MKQQELSSMQPASSEGAHPHMLWSCTSPCPAQNGSYPLAGPCTGPSALRHARRRRPKAPTSSETRQSKPTSMLCVCCCCCCCCIDTPKDHVAPHLRPCSRKNAHHIQLPWRIVALRNCWRLAREYAAMKRHRSLLSRLWDGGAWRTALLD